MTDDMFPAMPSSKIAAADREGEDTGRDATILPSSPAPDVLSSPHVSPSVALALVVSAMLCACATVQPSPPPTEPPLPRTAEPPPPKINLSGFPLAYRQGYADGCSSASGPQRKDAERFASDTNYNMGWQDGISLCRKR